MSGYPHDGKTRRAKVRGREATEGELAATVAAYLPENYEVVERGTDARGAFVIIQGIDSLGWSMGLYVQPRLASGSMSCEEIT